MNIGQDDNSEKTLLRILQHLTFDIFLDHKIRHIASLVHFYCFTSFAMCFLEHSLIIIFRSQFYFSIAHRFIHHVLFLFNAFHSFIILNVSNLFYPNRKIYFASAWKPLGNISIVAKEKNGLQIKSSNYVYCATNVAA